MKFPQFNHYLTGIAVPLSALYTKDSCGIGEFPDLVPIAGLCKKCGIQLIQLLPINDTGTQVSPYSAVSAYALHPVYVRLQNIPGSEGFSKEIDVLRKRYAASDRVAFNEVQAEKLRIAGKIYRQEKKKLHADGDLLGWIAENPWVKIYGVYKTLKRKNDEKSWLQWQDENERLPGPDFIAEKWSELSDETMFHAWLQYHCETQLRNAAETMSSINVALKGDLPILMSEDSADVWMHRDLFKMDLRAGAPPDMYSDDGQNWGFPIYDWKALEKADYHWWKDRLQQAEKFYHAFRIDHVLGFFRIWAVPVHEESAAMGHYEPYKYITQQSLNEAGFSKERLTWLSNPHVYLHEINDAVGDEAEQVISSLNRIGDEDLFLFDESIRGTEDINRLPLSGNAKQAMKSWFKNRTLLQIGKNKYFNSWHFTRSRGYQSLSEQERTKLYEMIDAAGKASERSWERKGKQILSTLQETTDMLICAEDLGVVPACVPRVLGKLGILGLKIGFWTREYKKPGHPFVPVDEYPRLSVATLSVHDSQVFREWWDVSAGEEEKAGFCTALDIEDISDKPYSPEIAEQIIKAFFNTSSFLAVLQIQDFFALVDSLRTETTLERINIPGTVSEMNWTYRLPRTIEALSGEDALCSKIQKLTQPRRDRHLEEKEL